MKGYRDTRLLEMLDYIDQKYIEKTKKYYRSVPARGSHNAKIDPKKQIKYIVALVASVLVLSAFIPAVTYIIQNHLNIGGVHETTGGDTTLAPEITSEDQTSSPAPESSVPETTETEPEHETTEPLYDGTTAPPEVEYDGSRGLVYKLADDGKSAWLFGMGTCTDEDIVVASTYDGVPVTMIGEASLADYSRVKSVTLPDTVTAIDMRAFKNCTGLEKVTIPDGVSFIGADAFENCKLLKSITLPAGLEKLETTLFMNCIGLESVVIPAGVKSISSQVFRECSALEELDYLGTVREWNAVAKDEEWNIGSAIKVVHCTDGDVEITFAQPPEPDYDGSHGLEYKISDDGKYAILVGIGSCTNENIVIASKYNGVPVTAIGDSAFFNCTGIKSVYIPESVTSIGAHAFSLCSSLESITLPDKVTSIETYAFHACTSLKIANLGKGVKKIGDFAFDTCEKLEIINFGNSLQSIGYQAFMHCASLKELTFPESLTSIGDWAFDCPSLERVSVGKNIKKIGEAAFIMCDKLSEFVYRGTREAWKSVTLGEDWKSRQFSIIKCLDGNIDLNAPPEYDGSQGLVYQLSKDKKSASLVKIGTCTDKNIVIASTFGGVPVISVAEGVFKDNQNITGIHIPATLTTLNGLFYNCQNIVSLTVDPDHPSFYSAGNCIIDKQSKTILVGCNGSVIPDDGSILRIGMSSFDGCNGITELILPDGVLIIYAYAFDNCINLRSVKIPDSLTKINSAFNGCTSLRNVELPSKMEWLGGFSDCISLREITLPKTARLSSGAFKGCTALESVNVPSDTTSLISTFEGCTSLKSVVLADTLTSIGESAFLNCTSLESITIPVNVTELNKEAFKNCSRLSVVNFAGTVEEWRSIFKATDWNENCSFGVIRCSDGEALPGPESDGSNGLEYVFDIKNQYVTLIGIGSCTDSEIIVPTTYGGLPVTRISQAFGGNFTSIVISESVTDIEEGAFADCPNLKSVHFPASVKNIPVKGLMNCKHLESLTVAPENPNYTSSGNCIIDRRTGILLLGLDTSVIPSDGSVNKIGEKAFINRSGLAEIIIPEGVTVIGEHAFANCTELKSVFLPGSLKEIGLQAFSGCTSLVEIKIEAAEVIFDYAFKDCTSLESIVLPNSCEVLNGRIFENCTSLKSVKLPETLMYLNCLFVNCPSLESVTLPASLTQLDSSPFVDCNKLTDLRFAGATEEWNAVEKPLFWHRGCMFTVIHCSDGDATP